MLGTSRPLAIMDVSWSLAVQEQLYVCLPLFLLAAFFPARRRWLPLVAFFVLSIAICAFVLSLTRARPR